MIQQSQNEFDSSVEKAEDWMKTIQERLRINDDTKGPRSALEARLRDTEKICALEPEGRLKMDLVLMKADALLQCISEEQKHEILSRLKDVKAMWEETAIYITHCHSRIEWVWLHWSEYLKAQDEFYIWLHNTKVTLEPDIELQLGLKEKQWQLSHAEVLLKDVQNRSSLLDRLLEEALSLYNRIGDASVDEDAREKMKEEYEDIKDEAEDITNDVRSGEKKFKHLEAQSVDVMQNTSPLGAEKMKAELEELKKLLENIKLVSVEEEEKLLKILQSENTYHSQARLLEADVQEFRKRLQRLGNHFEKDDVVRSDEDLISLWREYMATKANLTAEEPKAEKLKIQLKELFKFSQDLQPLSESVIHAIREHQSLKGKMFKLSTEIETELRQRFQNPLREFQLWKPSAQRLLDTTAHVSDPALTDAFLRQIEVEMSMSWNILELCRASQAHQETRISLGCGWKTVVGDYLKPYIFLVESSHLKEQLLKVQMKNDFLGNIFKEERAKLLLEEVGDATKELENLHKGLLQRKSRLQALVSQHKDFDASFKLLQTQLSALRVKLSAEKELLPDLVGKEARLQRLEIMIAQNKQHIQKHWAFNDKLSDLQQWLTVTKQKLEYYCDATTHNAILDLERKMAKGEDTNELQLIKNFEQWLQRENNKLSKILALNPSNSEEVKARYSKLKELQLRVPEGQYHFEELLHLQPAGQNWDELEELRYQWMLYKSKLKDSNNTLVSLNIWGQLEAV
ncbi:hypothetical protein Chor_016913 [Crotalus horridus]